MLRLGLWCIFVVWPSYLLEIAVVAALKQRVTPPFSDALRVGLLELPTVVVGAAGYGALLVAATRLLVGFPAQTVAVLALATLVQFWMREVGGLILARLARFLSVSDSWRWSRYLCSSSADCALPRPTDENRRADRVQSVHDAYISRLPARLRAGP